jgi:hypothetical protein
VSLLETAGIILAFRCARRQGRPKMSARHVAFEVASSHTPMKTAGVLLAFALLFSGLTVSSYVRKSATFDEPRHLTAGYTMLRLHDYREELEHPPLLRMWAALPLLAMSDIRLDTDDPGWTHPASGAFSRRFLYEKNDGDRLLYRARAMIVLLGILLGVLLFLWARQLFGFGIATIVLALYALEPNILAHSRLVTTDIGLTFFFFGTIYFAWRTTRAVTLGNLLGLIGLFALAQISKFSAVLLGPIVLLLLLVHAAGGAPFSLRIGRSREVASRGGKALLALGLMTLSILASWGAVWAVYGFRYTPLVSSPSEVASAPSERDPDEGPRAIWDPGKKAYVPSSEEYGRVPRLAAAIGWIDRHHLLPNACTAGFLQGQAVAKHRWAFLAGEWKRGGRWYYFPVAFLIKTPLTLLLLLLAGLACCAWRWKTGWRDDLFLLLPAVLYFGASIAVPLNIGVRHLLPIYPLVLLLAGKSIHAFRGRLRPGILAIPLLLAAGELATVYPHYLAFFNVLVGGPRNGHLYLLDSNLDWGEDLKPLKGWMDEQRVTFINLRYFGSARPAYYGIHCIELPPVLDRPDLKKPRLPGLLAISAQHLQKPPPGYTEQVFYKPLLEQRPLAVIGYSIYVYSVDRPWWPGG